MQLQKKQGTSFILMGWLLLFAAFLGSVSNVRATVVVEHTHAAGHHEHDYHTQDPGDMHSHHSHGESSPKDQDVPQPGGDTHHHQIDHAHAPFCALSDFHAGLLPPSFDRLNSVATSDVVPSGPIFELIKPPQIG